MEPLTLSVLLALAPVGVDKENTQSVFEGPQIAATCFKTGEQTSGMNKICYYDCLGSASAITIKSTQLCPLTIRN